jgi:hypothetical protein
MNDARRLCVYLNQSLLDELIVGFVLRSKGRVSELQLSLRVDFQPVTYVLLERDGELLRVLLARNNP